MEATVTMVRVLLLEPMGLRRARATHPHKTNGTKEWFGTGEVRGARMARALCSYRSNASAQFGTVRRGLPWGGSEFSAEPPDGFERHPDYKRAEKQRHAGEDKQSNRYGQDNPEGTLWFDFSSVCQYQGEQEGPIT